MRFESCTVSAFILLRPVATMVGQKRSADDGNINKAHRTKRVATLADRRATLEKQKRALRVVELDLEKEEAEEAAQQPPRYAP